MSDSTLPVFKINEMATVREALKKYNELNFCTLLVADSNDKIIGKITLQKILANIEEKDFLDMPIKKWITRDANVISADAALDIIKISKQHKGQKLTGIVEEGKLIDAYKQCDIMEYVSEQYYNMYDKLYSIIESAKNGIIAIDDKGIIFVYNYAAARIFKTGKEELIGQHISKLDKRMELLEVVNTGKPQTVVKRIINNYTIVTNRSPLIKDGAVIGAVAIVQDISDLESVSKELQTTKGLLKEIQTILESSYDGIFITDEKGKVLMVNSAWEQICGLSRQEVVGITAQEMVRRGIYTESAVQKVVETGKTSTVMLEMVSGNKGQKILATGTPIFDEDGQLTRVIANIRNITDLVNLKSQLEYSWQLTEKYSSEIKEIRRQQQFSDIVANSKDIQNVLEIVSRAADVDTTVLITGESGVGKEVVAKYLHTLSRRKNGPFIKINCAAIPATLLESELFGYEAGAFTGASKQGKIGLFELAHEGTLLLDEIGEMPLELQSKLLRAIQSKEITRIGGEKPVEIDVRIVAATNRNLEKMMKEGIFRADLFYRLNVININITPLRNRTEDIPALIFHFLDRFNKKYNCKKSISHQVVDTLIEYQWPGNIREMENLIERLVVLTDDNEITINHLPESYLNTNVMEYNIQINGIIPLKEAVEEVEKQLILRAKQKYGSTRRMAKVLGVDQSTIVRKINSWPLPGNAIAK